MNYQKILKSSLLEKKDSTMSTVAIIGGVAVGLAIGALFATKNGRETKSRLINFLDKLTGRSSRLLGMNQLGNIVENVRGHIKQNTESLLGPENHRQQASEIHVESAGTTAWKNQQEKPVFPNDTNPNVIYN
ncbi:YtxH domain-containing protein [Pedobacter polaris]|uniref:YtxH domain-containing protein n=1 Tax=Pedobacter polaris TaxID=2571273 RepID=A0A4U1CQV0_9SPHI|nr:YtxH domain-containing protein [Pedobacter polaris]TKC10401.1 YtxH domain-containing protein [Pedobacter polaris]